VRRRRSAGAVCQSLRQGAQRFRFAADAYVRAADIDATAWSSKPLCQATAAASRMNKEVDGTGNGAARRAISTAELQ
jgi:hypothetical protein